ncbi:hypothetical protein A9R01_11340 ['Osedax' symbiont bacterium Rs2_46_30_T18]|nr:hypothetical protein A9R01_11340 ['Osedax' symbiont bacterium Rs2_46_30_T18]
MSEYSQHPAPADAQQRRNAKPVICYSVEQLPRYDHPFYQRARSALTKVDEVIVPPRDAASFIVPAGHFFRISSVEGSQVGDLNLFNANNLKEHFYSGKTRQLHASHLSVGDRLWSNLPSLRAIATITHDTLDWYGWDQDGAGVHDVIGTRCDPYTNQLLKQTDYHYCCHSNLTRALAQHLNVTTREIEHLVHDVMNVFMCTGFSKDTHQYFMKASPVRPGDFLEFFAEIDLLGVLSACPGGDCGSSHSDDNTPCFPLKVEIFKTAEENLANWSSSELSKYTGGHGV